MSSVSTILSKEQNDLLRAKFNPEGSKLRTDQLRLLSMLRIIDKICKDNQIPYWLSSGTLLGCARHGGFIPWDDDMDIFMLKKDYKRFLDVMVKYDSADYVFHCMETDPDYVNIFGKFRDKNGRIDSKSPRYKFYKYAGIGLDVFAIEKTNFISAYIAGLLYNTVMKSTVHILNSGIRHFYTKSLEFLFSYIVFPVLLLFGMINPKGEYHLALGTGFPKQRVFLKDVFPLEEGLFENEEFFVPHCIDNYLMNLYGDWRRIPSESDILSSIHNREYQKEILSRVNSE